MMFEKRAKERGKGEREANSACSTCSPWSGEYTGVCLIEKGKLVRAAHAFNPITPEAEAGISLWVRGQPVYEVSFRTTMFTQKNPVLKNKTK